MDSLALKSPQFVLNCKNCFWALANGRIYPYSSSSSSSSSSFSCLLPFFSQRMRLRGNSAIVAAAKKENTNINKRKKNDRHSFVPKPDEATGPYPEAILLKERKVEEDGRLMPEFADVEERELFEALNLQLESDMDVDQIKNCSPVSFIVRLLMCDDCMSAAL